METMLKDGVRNPALDAIDVDVLYHLGLDTSMDLRAMFGDVKYVCMGGSGDRAEELMHKAIQELGLGYENVEHGPVKDRWRALGRKASLGAFRVLDKLGLKPEANEHLRRLAVQPIGKQERFRMFKCGPVLSVSHGMGMPSMSILLHELAKLLYYAGCEETKWIRIGTSGGVGVEPGTVVVSNGAVNGELNPVFEQIELGQRKEYPAELDQEFAQEILDARGNIRAVLGKTMGTDDFHEGQGRLDGALKPGYSESEKMAFLERAHEAGVRNIEMESVAFAAFCLRAGIPAAIVCAALLNRLEGDQVTSTGEQLGQFSNNAQRLVLTYIRMRLAGTLME